MNFKEHLETAWHMTLKYIAPLIIMTLVMSIVSIVSLGILAPVIMAGYLHAVLLMLREGREPKVQDLVSQMRLFLPLFIFGIIVFFAVLLGYSLLILPGILVMIAVSYCCLYMLPLMIDKESGIVDAIKESYAMSITDNLVDNIAVYIIYIGLLAMGSSVFIGFLFTQPFAAVFLLSVYEEKIKTPL
jgi:hypothetical protein